MQIEKRYIERGEDGRRKELYTLTRPRRPCRRFPAVRHGFFESPLDVGVASPDARLRSLWLAVDECGRLGSGTQQLTAANSSAEKHRFLSKLCTNLNEAFPFHIHMCAAVEYSLFGVINEPSRDDFSYDLPFRLGVSAILVTNFAFPPLLLAFNSISAS